MLLIFARPISILAPPLWVMTLLLSKTIIVWTNKWRTLVTLLTWINVNKSKLREFTKTVFRGTLTTDVMLTLIRQIIKVLSRCVTSARPKKLSTRELLILNLPEKLNFWWERMDKMSLTSSLRTLLVWCHLPLILLLTGLRLLLTTTQSFLISPRHAKLIFKSTIMVLVQVLKELTDSLLVTETVTWPTSNLLNYPTSTLKDKELVQFPHQTVMKFLTKLRKWLKL